MEHSHGSFKANSARVVRAVKETDPPRRVATLVSARTIKIRARNLAKLRLLPKK
jgi:hypothetical protein